MCLRTLSIEVADCDDGRLPGSSAKRGPGKKSTEVARMKTRPKRDQRHAGKRRNVSGHAPSRVHPFVNSLKVAADALDVDVKREHAFEAPTMRAGELRYFGAIARPRPCPHRQG